MTSISGTATYQYTWVVLTSVPIGRSLSIHMVTVWHRCKTKTIRILNSKILRARATRRSTPPLPYEIVEMIFTHLIHDLRTLKACSLVCRSWYPATVQHLHHTLTLREDQPDATRSRLEPLSELHELGLISLVKEIRVSQGPGPSWFVPQAINHRFSALANVHTLKLENIEIHRFIPDLKHYFGHFSLTVRFIALYDPHCTPRQLSHFLSLFPDLDDVDIRLSHVYVHNTAIPDTGLVPHSTPKLRGRLVLYSFGWVETWAQLITSCGGLRFRHMDLSGGPCCAPFLLKACAETLETLRFNAREPPLSK